MTDALARLAAELRAEGGLVGAVATEPHEAAALGPEAARGPRSAGREAEVELLVEAIREGELVHYATPRVLATDDADLALLAGDRLYALGLERLAALGDLEAVAALADVISGAARAHAEDRPEGSAAAWREGVRAIGWDAGSARDVTSRGIPGQ